MSDKKREKVSALVDGELGRFEQKQILDALRDDDGLRDRWQRYHMIGDAIQRALHVEPTTDLAERVRKQIDDDGQPYHMRMFSTGGLVRFALAASIAVVAVLALRGNDSVEQPGAPRIALNNEPAQGRDLQLAGTAGVEADDPAVRAKLNTYLIHHAGFSSGRVTGSTLPYARVASEQRD